MCCGSGTRTYNSSSTFTGKGSSKGVVKSEARILRESGEVVEASPDLLNTKVPKARKSLRAKTKSHSKPVAGKSGPANKNN